MLIANGSIEGGAIIGSTTLWTGESEGEASGVGVSLELLDGGSKSGVGVALAEASGIGSGVAEGVASGIASGGIVSAEFVLGKMSSRFKRGSSGLGAGVSAEIVASCGGDSSA